MRTVEARLKALERNRGKQGQDTAYDDLFIYDPAMGPPELNGEQYPDATYIFIPDNGRD